MTSKSNPYIAGSPVKGEEMFFGREDIFKEIRAHLIGKEQDNPIIIWGQRRTGKTSVLCQLERRLNQSVGQERYITALVDVQNLNLNGLDNFLWDLADEMQSKLPEVTLDDVAFKQNARSAFRAFLGAVHASLGKQQRLLLMFDEAMHLQGAVQKGTLKIEIFDYLRSLMQHQPKISFVFSLGSIMEREKLLPEFSLMLNVACSLHVSFLDEPSARALITAPVAELYHFSEEAISHLLALTHRHPYFTQVVCHTLFTHWEKQFFTEVTPADIDGVLDEATALAIVNLKFIWDDSSPTEKLVLAAIGELPTDQVNVANLAKQLKQAGIPLKEREITQVLDQLTKREIITKPNLYVALMGRWLAKEKPLKAVKEEVGEEVTAEDMSVEEVQYINYDTSHDYLGEVELDKDEISIGRSKDNTIPLDDPAVSKKHAKITRGRDGKYYLEDMGSSIGTRINGQPITTPVILQKDCIIRIGSVQMTYNGDRKLSLSYRHGFELQAYHVYIKVYKGKEIKRHLLEDISLKILPGELVALFGGSGSGKFYLFDVLNGTRPPKEGYVLIEEKDLYWHLHFNQYCYDIGYVPLENIVHNELTIQEALEYALRLHFNPTEENIDERINYILTEVELFGLKHNLIKNLSGGQLKRVNVAVALISDPKVIFLDEPTLGTDGKIMGILRKEANNGKTVVLVTNNTEYLNLCNKIAFIVEGKLAFYGTPNESKIFFVEKSFTKIYEMMISLRKDYFVEKFISSKFYVPPTPPSLRIIENPQPKRGILESISLEISSVEHQTPILLFRQLKILFRSWENMLFPFIPILTPVLLYFVIKVFVAQFILFLMTCAGTLNVYISLQEIVKEFQIYKWERLNVFAYLASKLIVLFGVSFCQAVLMTFIVHLVIGFPLGGLTLLGLPIIITITLVTFASSCFGLFLSALNARWKLGNLIVTLFLILQVGLAGVLFPSSLSAITITYWGTKALGYTINHEFGYWLISNLFLLGWTTFWIIATGIILYFGQRKHES